MERSRVEITEQPEQAKEIPQPKTGDVLEQKLTEDGKNLEENAGEAGKEKRKVYTSGAEKIQDEAEEEYKEAKDEEDRERTKALMEQVIKYVTEKCETDPDYNALVIQEHKTWKRCYQFMSEKAQKIAPIGRRGMLIEGSTMFAWMDEYYQADDLEKIKAEEEEARKEAERRKELKKEEAERAAKAKKKPEKAVRAPKKKAETPKEHAKPKKNNQDIDGQMDLFSMMEI